MTVLNDAAAVAAAILLLELLVVVLILLGLFGGLAFGLHWSRGKTGWLFGKVNGYLPLVAKYTDIGTGYAAKPFILAGGWAARISTSVQALERMLQERRGVRAHAQQVAARPLPRPDDQPTEAIVLP